MNESTQSSRKLAAILFADVVGYTKLMQENEQAATKQLRYFQKSMNEIVQDHHGAVVNFYGDGALCTFSTPLEAIRCGMALQESFSKENGVPVRIGIHSGTIVQESGKVFGDSVNIASRIESMGIAGSILLSKNVRDELKNKPEFLLAPLGSYEFKNVEEPVTVFALINEGFPVPDKSTMQGKFKENKSRWKVTKMLVPFIVILGILFALWQWEKAENNSLLLNGVSSLETSRTPLSKEDRNKRVAVMVFENKTGDEYLEDFGTMISDWVTKGLMETGEANVISAANIQSQTVKAGFVPSDLNKFSQATGVGLILEGRYYLQEDQLIIHANVIDTEEGEVIHALDPIQGPKDKMLDLLDQLTDEILGYWSIKGNTRFFQNPPKYESYQKYLAADRVWNESEYQDFIEKNLLEAIELDPNFVEAQIKYAVYNGNAQRNLVKKDSILNHIVNEDYSLTRWEELRLNSVIASHEHKWQKAAELCEKMFKMDESDVSSAYNASNYYIRANMPNKAIAILNRIDNRFREMDEDEFSWIELRRIEAFYMSEQYDKVLEAAKNYTFPKMISHIAGLHLRSLIRIDSIAILDKVLNNYVNAGFVTVYGSPEKADALLKHICWESYMLDKSELLSQYAGMLKTWTLDQSQTENYHSNLGLTAFLVGELELAIEHLKNLDINRFFVDYLEAQSIIGYCQATLNKKDAVFRTIRRIDAYEAENLKNNPPNALQSAFTDYIKARIYQALGQNDTAISFAEKSIKKGAWFYPGTLWRNDIFLKELQEEPKFQELITPKG